MKFLTDENIDIRVFNGLKKAGFEIKDIKKESKSGISDKEILDLAMKEKRILITHDKDFENHPYFQKIKHAGVILLRFKNQSYHNVLENLLRTLNSKAADKLDENLTIITEDEIIIYKK